MRSTRHLVWMLHIAVLLGSIANSTEVVGQGLAISGVGPVNSAMGGVATATPVGSAGALYWNPATIVALPGSELAVGVDLVLPTSEVASYLPAGAFGSLPPFPLSGSDKSEAGVTPVPNICFVQQSECQSFAFGLGVFGVGGFRVNYPASTTNPVLTAPPPNGFGIGRVAGHAEVLQIAPTAACWLTPQISVGIAPTVSLAKLSARPLTFATPDDANGDGFASYPTGDGGRSTWGGGFQVGIYYTACEAWRFGFTVKSPQWFEDFRFKTETELGAPQVVKIDVEYPLILSLGTSYAGFEKLVVGCDVRYFDYANADGFAETGFDPTGAIRGLGLHSIFAVSTGLQYEATEHFVLRCGYSFNENPIAGADTAFNVGSPLISQHFFYAGASCRLTCSTTADIAYVHGFRNSSGGPLQTPGGAIPGSFVQSTVSLDVLTVGLTVNF